MLSFISLHSASVFKKDILPRTSLIVCMSCGVAKEALIKSAAVDSERFFVKTRFEKRRNTACISRFFNRRIGGKDPSSAVRGLNQEVP